MGPKKRKRGLQNFDLSHCIFCTTRTKNANEVRMDKIRNECSEFCISWRDDRYQ